LKTPYPSIHFEIHLIQKDPNKIFHARHLDTQTATILFERGFDLFKPRKPGEMTRQIMKWDMGACEHLKEIRKLKEVD
jgi:hypothetical protein